MEPEQPRWPKTCRRCGELWSRDEWPELPPIGRYFAGAEGWIELRTCVCGGTLVVPALDLGLDLGDPNDDSSDDATATA